MTSALDAIISRLSALPQVEAIALGGSRTSGMTDPQSDHDVYVFTTAPVPHDLRRELAEAFDPTPEIGNSWWGEGDYWTDDDATWDVMFWDPDWFESTLRRVIEDHQPSTGYTTAFWFTMRNLDVRFDRAGRLGSMQRLAGTPYPAALADAIVRYNHPLLRDARTSYRAQVDVAIARNDPVSLNHRITGFLASAFDIIFALTRTLHPGEKRQLTWMATLGDTVPSTLDGHIRELIAAQGDPSFAMVLPALDAVADDIDRMIQSHA